MRADELASEGLKNKNKTYLQKFLLTIFFVLLSAKETKQLCGEAQRRGMRFAVFFKNWVDFVWREKKSPWCWRGTAALPGHLQEPPEF